ncbi:MAG: DNA polymerase III delta subunit, partial [Planctomycetota bacterium]
KFLKEQGKSIARFAAEEDPQVWVIFEDDSIVKRKTKKFTKPIQALVDAGAQIVDCGTLYSSPFGFGKPVWDSDLSRWVVTRAKVLGRQMSLEAGYALHSRETSGLRSIAAQLDKIILSLGDATTIRVEDVQKQVGDDAEASIFEVVDQFAAGSLTGTMSAVDRIFRQGIKNAKGKRSLDSAEIALRLLSMISTRMRELGRILELKRDGHGFDDACGQVVGRGRTFLFPKIRAQLEARTPKALGQTVVDIERLDRDLKSGGGHPRDLFVFFMLKNLKTPSSNRPQFRSGAST